MTRVEFLGPDLWRRVAATVRRRRSRCYVAIAYFGEGAAELVPLTRGSVLVVDASYAAVKAGQTHPGELLKLIERDVEVFSAPNLHAKVVVAGDQAFVGSMNASRRSAKGLIESAIRTNDRHVVDRARLFVMSLASDRLGPEEARRLLTLYQPQRVPPLPSLRSNGRKQSAPLHQPVWVARTVIRQWDEDDFAAEKKGLPVVRKRLRDRQQFEIDDFVWEDSRLANVRDRHRIICLHEEPDGRVFVSGPAAVLHVEPYTGRRQRRRLIFFEMKKGTRRKALEVVLRQLSPAARKFLCSSHGRRVPLALADELLHVCGHTNS